MSTSATLALVFVIQAAGVVVGGLIVNWTSRRARR